MVVCDGAIGAFDPFEDCEDIPWVVLLLESDEAVVVAAKVRLLLVGLQNVSLVDVRAASRRQVLERWSADPTACAICGRLLTGRVLV